MATLSWSCYGTRPTERSHDISTSYEDHVPLQYKPLYSEGIFLQDTETFRAGLPYESISMERMGFCEKCPHFTVTFRRSGEAELDAVYGLPLLGKYVGRVDALTYGRLCYLIDRAKFHQLKRMYRAHRTDDATCIITVVAGSKQKQVEDYGAYGPIELWGIQEVIDRIREQTDWKLHP